MTDKDRADAMRAEATSLKVEAEAVDAELSAFSVEVSAYMAEAKERMSLLRLTIDDKLSRGRAAASEADRLDPHSDAKHATIGG